MAQELTLSNEENAAMDHLEKVLQSPQGTTPSAEALDVNDLCDKYHSIRAALTVLVKILKKIPGIGAKAAAALEFLMSLANTVCPVS
jgi:ERCC4-type nuclease